MRERSLRLELGGGVISAGRAANRGRQPYGENVSRGRYARNAPRVILDIVFWYHVAHKIRDDKL
jgi:hypothetical protein